MSMFRRRLLSIMPPAFVFNKELVAGKNGNLYTPFIPDAETYDIPNNVTFRVTATIKAPDTVSGKCCILGGHTGSVDLTPILIIDGHYAYTTALDNIIITDYVFDSNWHTIDYYDDVKHIIVYIDGIKVVDNILPPMERRIDVYYNGIRIFGYNDYGGKNYRFTNMKGAGLLGPMNIYYNDILKVQFIPTEDNNIRRVLL